MGVRGVLRYSRFILLLVVIAVSCAPAAFAQTATSNNYKMTESQFGSSDSKQTCSGQYCATTSLGDITSGKSSGTNSTASFGPITPNIPSLDIIIDLGISDLGYLNTETTATKTSVVKVQSYLSNGYVMQIVGEAPKYANHHLATSSTPVSSTPGVEQFGINATVNTIPAVGADPVQVPDAQTSFGFVTDDYKIPNKFKYVSGDVVGRSLKATGRTDYTISFAVNISNATPAGRYSGDYAAVVIPVY